MLHWKHRAHMNETLKAYIFLSFVIALGYRPSERAVCPSHVMVHLVPIEHPARTFLTIAHWWTQKRAEEQTLSLPFYRYGAWIQEDHHSRICRAGATGTQVRLLPAEREREKRTERASARDAIHETVFFLASRCCRGQRLDARNPSVAPTEWLAAAAAAAAQW
jgi:hypothetical protein